MTATKKRPGAGIRARLRADSAKVSRYNASTLLNAPGFLRNDDALMGRPIRYSPSPMAGFENPWFPSAAGKGAVLIFVTFISHHLI
ncbi:hypothetical protein [Salinicoccus halodurans]|uniref:hypothetical protein n=1 Tax=Salinicoccus halodurans TaxID=407035 RepID=UPI00117BC4DB|nr:hypothetical protein [Salinicoccus halodurans]